jgi:hypothetical protein
MEYWLTPQPSNHSWSAPRGTGKARRLPVDELTPFCLISQFSGKNGTMRFTKTEIIAALEREDKSYRLGMMCTHWIRDVELYTARAADLASKLYMQAGDQWISTHDPAPLLADPMKRELLSSDFLLNYLHTLIRAPFELLSDYCEDYDRAVSAGSLLNEMKSQPRYGVAYIVRNAVSHNFRVELGKMRDRIPIPWRTVTITEDMEGQPMTAAIFWHKPGYELVLEMRAFAEKLPEAAA